jgi:hypothetical protein
MTPKMTIDKFGTKHWKLPNGTLHREGIPTLIWYNCVRHREDDPAIEWNNGEKYWYLNGVEYTEREYRCKMRSIKLKLLL